MSGPQFIQLIADYGIGDPAFGEVIQKLQSLAPGVIVNETAVPSFNTIATGFWTLQFGIVNSMENMIIYTNTAPRKDDKESRKDNEGEHLVYALLKGGMKVVGVNAGYCFSFVKDQIDTLYKVNVANKGSQFRSRDFFPEAVVGIARGDKKFIGEKMDIANIPDIPKNKIAWVDGYGNIKTTVRLSDMKAYKSGQPVLVTLGTMKRTAWFSDGTFNVREGELAFAPGSSGGKDRFVELFLRGLSAWKEFGKPTGEEELTIEAFEK
jgi:S-adenosylmethionine hydrolase